MDPWSKVDYSRLIREVSMVLEKLPEVNPPSGRVPGQGLLAAPILETRWRRNKEEIAKKALRVSVRGANIGQRGPGGGPRGLGGHLARPPVTAPPGRLEPWSAPSGSPS